MADTEKLDAALALLNAEVDAAIAKRKAWMDGHMSDYARYRVGDVLYNLDTGMMLGAVTELYRYQAGHPEFDRSMSIDYKYREPRTDYHLIDNTSRQICLSFGNAEELVQRRETELRLARFKA